jgi:protein-S-isoprenylcysteine O-methyltransferase Ste14
VPDLDPALPHPKGHVAVTGESGPGRLRQSGPPLSATSAPVTFLGLIGFAVGLIIVWQLQLPPVGVILVMLASTALPMLIVDIFFLKVHRRPTTGLDWARPPDFSLNRSAIKLLGLTATLALLLLCYWLFPEYRGAQYAIVFDFFEATWPYVAAVSIVYVVVVDAYMADPRDGYWQAGCLVIGRLSEVDKAVFGQYCAGWLMKGFFIPFVISVFMADIDAVFASGMLKGEGGFRPLYEFCFSLSYAIDTAFGTLGYFLTIRLADSHIRSTDSTLLGWSVALACYPPFWPFLASRFLPYDAHAVFWGPWFEGVPPLYDIWGILILCCVGIYAWSTVIFGCRFSNLTNRGILTNGPYRWSKHPAYLSKNLSYWLIAIPFLSDSGIGDAIRGCLMLGLVNYIYYLRARTEERHLSRDPTYVAYAVWMNDHGALRWLGRIAPGLRYAPSATRPQADPVVNTANKI